MIWENKLKNHKKSQLCSHEDKTLKIGYGLLIWAERDYKLEQVMGFQITTDQDSKPRQVKGLHGVKGLQSGATIKKGSKWVTNQCTHLYDHTSQKAMKVRI